MNATERAPYLAAGDAELAPLGFRRKKREYVWYRKIEFDTEWIHLNFGLSVINPSFGVSYDDLNALLPLEIGIRCGPRCMLQSATGRSYFLDTPPNIVSQDMLFAARRMGPFHDRFSYAQQLMTDERHHELMLIFSERIRVLPVLLASMGRLTDALEWIDKFSTVAQSRDQIVPSYEVFSDTFKKVFGEKRA